MRMTKIICTIGPSSESEEMLRELVAAGMNVARFNFSHGTHKEHEEKFQRLRKVRIGMNLPIASLLDTRGPEIRLKTFRDKKVTLEKGAKFTLTTEDIVGDETRAAITYEDLPGDVKPGTRILIDDGLIGLKVDQVQGTEIICTVENGGQVSDRKGINVPDVELSMPFISPSDKEDIIFGCKMGFDFIACSFTRTADDIREIRKLLDACDSKMQVIAKIENMQGVNNIDEILEVSDGVMVARGDLGVEVPLEDVPIIQKKIIRKAQLAGKISITATQMLDSMMHNPRPTRAEITDVANAIYDGTTAIMLSGETAAGKYPVEAVKTMARIARRSERDINYRDRREWMVREETACRDTARRLSRLQPSCPVIACSPNSRVACQMNLLFGTVPIIIGLEENEEALFNTAIHRAELTGLLCSGDFAVLTAGVPLGSSGNTNMVRVVELP